MSAYVLFVIRSLLNYDAVPNNTTYTEKNGDTLSDIATINGISNPNLIYVSQVIKIS